MKFKSGFQAFDEEAERRKKLYDSMKGKLWRFFLKDGEKDAPIRFLTEEPICFFEHMVKDGAKWINQTCTGDDCPICAGGEKPQWVGAWLVVDGREYEQKVRKDGKETGETKMVKDRIKLLVRGMKDVAKLQSKSQKFGLTSREWFVTRTGTGNTTSWDFERADEAVKLSPKEIDALLQQLPAELRNMKFEDIVMLNVDPDAVYPEAVATPAKKEAAVEKASAGVKTIEAPSQAKKILSFKKK